MKSIEILLGATAVLLLSTAAHPQSERQGPRDRAESKLVQVPVVVVDGEGNLYGKLDRTNFRIFEDGQPREIVDFSGGESALNLVVLLENSRISRSLLSEVVRPASVLASQILERDDYAAIVAFDNRVRVVVDFTRDRRELIGGINDLVRDSAVFTESNLFDALEFTLLGGTIDYVTYRGLAGVEGRTGVLLVATGLDTMSALTFEDARRIAANSGVPVYSIGIGELSFIGAEPHMSGPQRLEFLQARNTLTALSEESGGHSYSPRFRQAIDDILESIAHMLRYQYTLSYEPAEAGKAHRREIAVRVDLTGDGRMDDNLELLHRRYYYPKESN